MAIAEVAQVLAALREGTIVDLRTGRKLADGFFKSDLVGCRNLLSVDGAALGTADEEASTC